MTWHRQAAFQIVWNSLDEFQRSEADWTRCTKPHLKDLPYLAILIPPSAVRIYASVNWVSIDSGNGFSLVRRQAITLNSADL